jgi:hypothetical protein
MRTRFQGGSTTGRNFTVSLGKSDAASPAISAVRRQTPPVKARLQCQCDRFLHLNGQQWVPGNARTRCAACLQRKIEQQKTIANSQTTNAFSARWTLNAVTARKKAAPPLDRGSADPGCSSCGFPAYAPLCRIAGNKCRGCNRVSAVSHPKHIDGHRHRRRQPKFNVPPAQDRPGTLARKIWRTPDRQEVRRPQASDAMKYGHLCR